MYELVEVVFARLLRSNPKCIAKDDNIIDAIILSTLTRLCCTSMQFDHLRHMWSLLVHMLREIDVGIHPSCKITYFKVFESNIETFRLIIIRVGDAV